MCAGAHSWVSPRTYRSLVTVHPTGGAECVIAFLRWTTNKGITLLHQFLTTNRTDLIARCRAKVAQRALLTPDQDELTNGISLFLDQLIKTFVLEETAQPMRI